MVEFRYSLMKLPPSVHTKICTTVKPRAYRAVAGLRPEGTFAVMAVFDERRLPIELRIYNILFYCSPYEFTDSTILAHTIV